MNSSLTISQRLDATWMMLKFSYGALFLIAGADKFFNWVTNWSQYLNPSIFNMLPMTIDQIFMIVAAIELTLSALILTKFTRMGAYLAAGWFGLIIINLVTMGKFYDIAARDAMLAVGAIALANLTDIKEMLTK